MESLSRVLGVSIEFLKNLDATMTVRTGKTGILEALVAERDEKISKSLAVIGVIGKTAGAVRHGLAVKIAKDEQALLAYLETIPGVDRFQKAAELARRMGHSGKGFFLKKDRAVLILKKRTPENLLKYLGVATIDEAIAKHDVTELFSALRFIESNEWMHETFEAAYSNFTPDDFEEREIEIRVLGPEWREISEKFVAKKHHNVSHLKEFGVIFLNPISENEEGKFIRDFALFLHYFHEVVFYSELFKRAVGAPDFAERLKSLLRGDVREVKSVSDGEWLIVQRYLYKEDQNDPRLFLPRINPESLHWLRGERNISNFKDGLPLLDLSFWNDMDWVGEVYEDGTVVSFDLEDNAMSLVSAIEQTPGDFSYHQREALWTKMFFAYAGGEAEAEKLLIENFDKGVIRFK